MVEDNDEPWRLRREHLGICAGLRARIARVNTKNRVSHATFKAPWIA